MRSLDERDLQSYCKINTASRMKQRDYTSAWALPWFIQRYSTFIAFELSAPLSGVKMMNYDSDEQTTSVKST